jgi:hypothetical protein
MRKNLSLALTLALLLAPWSSRAASEFPKPKIPSLELYGYAMTDLGYNFGTIDPNWFDVMRPTKLPSSENEFGENGRSFMGVRQSRFGVRGFMPTSMGDLKSLFEFELFGVGVDAGQTTFRLRHFFGELGQFGAGQTWSPFMDIDVFPNSIEYWGPNGMPFFRNVQVRWMPIQDDSRFSIALERPGATADLAGYESRNELEGVSARFPLPDLSMEGRLGGEWGYVELAGILRYLVWDDLGTEATDLSGSALGWGVNLSSIIKLGGKNKLKLLAVYGHGIGNYMNDAGDDIGIQQNPGDAITPIEGVALPVLGLVAFVDINWSDHLTSTAGYSMAWIDNTDGQAPSAFHMGQYALANLLIHPTERFMLGPELQWGRRTNFSDGFTYDDFKVQFSMKYDFSLTLTGK